MRSSCSITKLWGSQCTSLLLLVHFPCFRYMTSILIYVLVCHPTLCTDWFLKLGANGHAHALTVFKHVYKEYAANVTPLDNQPMTCNEFDSDSDNGILESAAAHLVLEQTSPSPKLPSKFMWWVANEGGAGKMHYSLVWWKVFHFVWLTTTSKLTVLYIRLTQISSQSFRKWHRIFSWSWGLQFWLSVFSQAHDTFAGTCDHH